MSEYDATQAFLESLPEIAPDETFAFACDPGVGCFGACCGDLNLLLTPYDALRMRKGLEQSSKDFIGQRCQILSAPDTHFPLLQLRMTENPGKPCPLVQPEGGCGVYPHRPSACRTYPLGRASRLTPQGGVETRYFVVREDHCKGFARQNEWSIASWEADQGLEDYHRVNDRYTELMGRQKVTGKPLDHRRASMAFLALYQPDRFQEFVQQSKLFDRVEVDEARQQAILSDEEAALDFALDWLELMLFGECPNLKAKAAPPQQVQE